jgi:hypothetical protein
VIEGPYYTYNNGFSKAEIEGLYYTYNNGFSKAEIERLYYTYNNGFSKAEKVRCQCYTYNNGVVGLFSCIIQCSSGYVLHVISLHVKSFLLWGCWGRRA